MPIYLRMKKFCEKIRKIKVKGVFVPGLRKIGSSYLIAKRKI